MPNFYMKAMLDADGQPVIRAFGQKHRFDRASDEFIGLAKGVMLDGDLGHDELKGIAGWLCQNEEFINQYPFYLVFDRLQAAMADGVIDEDERRDLGNLLHEIAGGINPLEEDRPVSGTAFLDDPEPIITFADKLFVFTGCCASATRKACEEAVRRAGGVAANAVTKHTNYLVVGVIGSEDWMHSSHGRKIEKAIDYRNRFGNVSIISEPHWLIHLNQVLPGGLTTRTENDQSPSAISTPRRFA